MQNLASVCQEFKRHCTKHATRQRFYLSPFAIVSRRCLRGDAEEYVEEYETSGGSQTDVSSKTCLRTITWEASKEKKEKKKEKENEREEGAVG